MNKVYQYKSLQASVKDVDEKKGIVTGYFSAFGNVDSDGDIMMPGAFTKSIEDHGPTSQRPRIKHLLNHNPSQPLGVITSLKEDNYGLYYESKVGTHTLGKDFLKMVDSGLVSEHSIGFKTIREGKSGEANLIHEVKLYEGSSLTGWGANEMTPLTGIKGDIDLLQEKAAQLEKFIKNSDVSDETIELLEIQIKQLLQLIQDNEADKSKGTTTQNEPDELAITLQLINKRMRII